MNTNINVSNVITLNTNINKEDMNMKANLNTNVTTEANPFNVNGLYANYDTKKVERILQSAEVDRRQSWLTTMGINLENVHSMESALKISGLDFEVEKRPLYFTTKEEGRPPRFHNIPEMYSTTRMDTKTSLGVVGKDYQILQNREAFDFLDSMVVGGAKFETAGTFKKNGAASYISMSTEPMNILGDNFQPYILFTNSFDGKGSVRICFAPMRIICKNTAMVALRGADNVLTIHHSSLMYDRLVAARDTLVANTKYMTELKKVAEELAVKPFSEEAFRAMAEKLFPVKTEDSETLQIRNLSQIEKLMRAYKEEDLDNFKDSAWRAFQAVSDFQSHPSTFRKVKEQGDQGSPEFKSVIVTGMPLLNQVLAMLQEAV